MVQGEAAVLDSVIRLNVDFGNEIGARDLFNPQIKVLGATEIYGLVEGARLGSASEGIDVSGGRELVVEGLDPQL